MTDPVNPARCYPLGDLLKLLTINAGFEVRAELDMPGGVVQMLTRHADGRGLILTTPTRADEALALVWAPVRTEQDLWAYISGDPTQEKR